LQKSKKNQVKWGRGTAGGLEKNPTNKTKKGGWRKKELYYLSSRINTPKMGKEEFLDYLQSQQKTVKKTRKRPRKGKTPTKTEEKRKPNWNKT